MASSSNVIGPVYRPAPMPIAACVDEPGQYSLPPPPNNDASDHQTPREGHEGELIPDCPGRYVYCK